MTWGKDVEFLEQRKAAGKPAPALEQRPVLYEDLADVWGLFWQLHRSRQYAFGANPLAVTDIRAALELYALADPLECYELIVAMDQEWLRWESEQRDKGK